MSAVVTRVCDGCNDELPGFRDCITLSFPRRGHGGHRLPPVVLELCSPRCLQNLTRRKRTDSEPCRPWCVSQMEGEPVCSCVDDQPGDSYDPWEAAGL